MAQYIDKAALLARIKKLKMDIGNVFNEYDEGFWEGRTTAFDDVICALDTLEVKDADLEKEIQRQYNVHKNPDNSIVKDCVIMTKDGFEYFAKHFFELGLCSTITKEDCKLIWNIGDDLPYMPEEDFFKELLRRYKAQKGKIV